MTLRHKFVKPVIRLAPLATLTIQRSGIMKTNCCHSNHVLELENNYVCLNDRCKNYMSACQLSSPKVIWRNLAALSLFGFYMMFSMDDFSKENSRKMEIIYRNQASIVPCQLNQENLEKEIEKNEMICPKEVKAQIMLESGNLNSFLLKRTNNMLGMRYPYGRETKAVGLYIPARDTIIYGNRDELKKYRNANQYAVFNTWQDAVEDYKLWQVANFRLAEKYLSFLGNVYAEDTAYVAKIRQVAARNQ
jgi:hypothetical protein